MSTTTELPATFILPRRRKVAQFRRRRSDSPSSPESSNTSTADTPEPPTTTILRPRRPQRRFGLEVTTTKPTASPSTTSSPPTTTTAEERAAAAEAEALAVVNRFTRQTGQIADVDKHMMAYVESEMSKRRGEVPSATNSATSSTNTATTAAAATPEVVATEGKSSYWAPTRPEARGATLGKLHEVDLGEEAKQRNIALTAQALSGNVESQQSTMDDKHRRNRRRRNSQDIERDRLVEEVLKETRLDLYPEDVDMEEDMDEQGAADDKIAEKFRKEFLDAILSKRRRRGADPKAKASKKEDKKRPKGPKLGGSRMARAQMREQQGGVTGAGVRK
ncbi:hepatocellular carcinoma-associated antigen 59-domain-containing protein [Trichophaea hybrida]|nr:hepatocellular carcinoma-associated antigen 59-domain-containing protein [Trichophaea hybrida]